MQVIANLVLWKLVPDVVLYFSPLQFTISRKLAGFGGAGNLPYGGN